MFIFVALLLSFSQPSQAGAGDPLSYKCFGETLGWISSSFVPNAQARIDMATGFCTGNSAQRELIAPCLSSAWTWVAGSQPLERKYEIAFLTCRNVANFTVTAGDCLSRVWNALSAFEDEDQRRNLAARACNEELSEIRGMPF
jgi:hypothetical protein